MQALTVFRLISHGADSADIADTLYNVGINYAAVGESIKSREALRQALDIYKTLDPQNPNIATIDYQLHLSKENITNTRIDVAKEFNKIGRELQTRKRHDEAEKCFNQSLIVYKDVSVDGESLLLAGTLNSLGVNYCGLKHYSEAEQCLTQALSMHIALSNGADSEDIANTLCNLAVCDLYRGNKQAAIGKFTKAHDIYMKVNPTNPHVHIIAAYLSVTAECKEIGESAKKKRRMR